MSKPYSLKIYVPGGDPDGLRTIEKSNWTGTGLVFPRALFAEAKARPELGRTGVYILAGPPEASGLRPIYVGEGDPIKPRLDQHAAKKDFWTLCVAFTSKDAALNKAHAQYLEARLVELATVAKRCELENGNVPARPSLSEADVAEAEGFLGEILLCLPLVGIDVFQGSPSAVKSKTAFHITSKGLKAEGFETSEGFVVRQGSTASATEVPSCQSSIRALRAALINKRVLAPTNCELVFTQDYTFASPSTAAAVVQGRTANGRVDWKTKSGETLKACQARNGA